MSEIGEQPYRLLLFWHDTVECAYYLRAPRDGGIDFERLTYEREALRQSRGRDPKLLRLGGVEFLLQRYGSSSGFPIVLDNADIAVQCGEYNSPSFFVTYRSEALWRDSGQVLHERFLDWAHGLGFEEYRREGLSRVDFTFDYRLPRIDLDEESFVSLSSIDSKHRRDQKLRGVAFGQLDVRLRVYDKVAEIVKQSLEVWFFELWGLDKDRGKVRGGVPIVAPAACTQAGIQPERQKWGWDGEVWRIEWQVRKALLRRFGIRSFADLADQQGDLLRYLAREHDTSRLPGEDPNRSRWPLHPLWIDLQGQVERLEAQGVYREIDPQAVLRERLYRLAISMYGNLKRVAALDGVERGASEVSHAEALRRLEAMIAKVHNPVSWRMDVQKRVDQVRLGQWRCCLRSSRR